MAKFKKTTSIILIGLMPILLSSCIQFPDTGSLLPVGTPFVMKGTATVLTENGPCPAWIGTNGVTYHLFQNPLLENEVFDQVVRPGVTSRLVLATRRDLELTCQVGTLVEVREVLEIE